MVIAGALMAATQAAPAAGLDDAQIIGIYLQVNSFDIETALLGRAQASSDDLRKLAEHVATDHLGVRQAAEEIAAQCGVAPVLSAARRADAIVHDKTMATLLPLKDSAFDRAYLSHEVTFHRAAIEAVTSVLLPAAKCPALKTHLQQVLPAFQQHLAHTETLAHMGDAK
jgi:putative membrane protein